MKLLNVRRMILTALFTALITVGTYIKIPNPFFPVFFTFQGVFCALAGLVLGPGAGAASVALYIAMGLAGLPVFSTPAGPQYIFQPTFGFLIGFVLAAVIIGKISKSSAGFSTGKSFLAFYSGLAAIYAAGICYMYIIYNYYNGNAVGMWALVSSMAPYLLKDFILFTVLAVSAVKIKKQTGYLINC